MGDNMAINSNIKHTRVDREEQELAIGVFIKVLFFSRC